MEKKKKGIKLNPFIILFAVIVICAIFTHIVTPGVFERHIVDGKTVLDPNSTTLGTMSGLICDGAKSSCATKIASGISCAFDSYYASKKNRNLLFGEGIIGRDVEATIKNTGILGKDGMLVTDKVILDIMVNNK